jgi:uncharacterized protein involved in exopolysaccharide biosynthesis
MNPNSITPAPGNPETDTEPSLELTQYLYVVLRYKWLILLCVVILVSLALLHNRKMVPVYRATATIIIDPEMPKIPMSQGLYYYQSYLSEIYSFNTHFRLITSHEVLKDVVKRMGLDRIDRRDEKKKLGEPNIFKKYINQFKSNIRRLLSLFSTRKQAAGPGADAASPQAPEQEPGTAADAPDRADRIANSLGGMIEIEPVEETRLLKINVTNTDPAMARDVANTLAQAYIDFNIQNRVKSTQENMGWLTDQLYEMKKKLEDAEAEFLAYKKSVNLISVEDSQKRIAEKIANFNSNYLEARNRRLEIEAKLNQLGQLKGARKNVPHLRSLIENNLINSLYSQMLEAELERSRLRKKYRSKHPKTVQANSRISNIRNKLDQEINKEVGSLEAERSVLIAREQVLQQTVKDLESEAMDTSTKELESTILERNLETNQRLYDAILVRIKESNISGNLEVSNIRITEKAVLPRGAINQGKRRNVLMAALIGFMIGAGLAFLWEYMDRSLRSEEDIDKYLGLPVLSVIPVGEQAKDKAYGDGE